MDFIHILGERNFESSEMALSLIEKYADEVDYSTKLNAIDVLETLKEGESGESLKGKYDNLHYIEHALELLRD